jgi:lipopolysaccharide/colanic/teichoic acid biosynthesis glycosyltransferase
MYQFLKRIIDLVLASTTLLVLLPLFIPIVFLLKLTGEGEIFYFQKRIGKDCHYFDIWKFATMLKNSPNIGSGAITLRNDPRVTPMGNFLRKSKINELPQIINVFKGDMSIVGPRPTVKKHADAYPKKIRNKIYSIKPGITGVGSIIFRDEEELISKSNMEPFEYYKEFIIPYKAKVELWYQDHKSLSTDFLIIFLTAWVIFFPKSDLIYNIFKDLPKRSELLLSDK